MITATITTDSLRTAELGILLRRCGYDEPTLRQRLPAGNLLWPSESDLLLWRHAIAGGSGDALDTLIQLFLLRDAVDATVAEAALRPTPLAQWQADGLIQFGDDGHVTGAVRLVPHEQMVLAWDWSPRFGQAMAAESVMGVGRASNTLAQLTVRPRSRSTLDLGCGCGIQGLLAARHSDKIVATDLNARAVALTTFNAKLNGIEQLEAVEGSLLDPVRQRRFDLIIANPPFVVSPQKQFLYRDSGLRLDEVCRRIVTEAPDLLEDGGWCQLLCNWVHLKGERWQERLAGWFADSGCDVWVMRILTQEPAAYAAQWLKDGVGAVHDQQARLADWLAYLAAENCEAVSSGLITMRRRRGHNWLRCDDGPAAFHGPCGSDIMHIFAATDFLETADDEQLLPQRVQVSDSLRLKREFQPSQGQWAEAQTRVELACGLGYGCRVDGRMAALAARCDGTRALRQVVQDLAAKSGIGIETLLPISVQAVREMLRFGLLRVVS